VPVNFQNLNSPGVDAFSIFCAFIFFKALYIMRLIPLTLALLICGCVGLIPPPLPQVALSEQREPRKEAAADTSEALDSLHLQIAEIQPTTTPPLELLLWFAETAQYDSLLNSLDSFYVALSNGDTLQQIENVDSLLSISTDLLPAPLLDSLPEGLRDMWYRELFTARIDSIPDSIADSLLKTRLNCIENRNFAIPLELNQRVFSALIAFSNRTSQVFQRWLDQGYYYQSYLIQQIVEAGLPPELSWLPLIESGFNLKARSHAKAVGMWQFIPSTGVKYGLRQSYWLDERREPIKATQAAIAYFQKLFGDFSDWHLSLAAYNCGEGCVGRRLRRAAEGATYWDLRLPRETRYYVPKFLAATIIAQNPHCFGYQASAADAEIFEPETLMVSSCVDLSKVAKLSGVDPKELKELNPHILRWCTPPDFDNVTLHVPQNTAQRIRHVIDSLPEEEKVDFARYRIRPGDNLISIAHRFDISVSAIRSVNNLRGSRIIAGRYLIIPLSKDAVASALSSKASTERLAVASAKNKEKVSYRVKRGDTVSEIAALFGVSSAEVLHWNNLSSARSLRAGSTIVIYRSPAAAPSAGKASSKAPAYSGPIRYHIVQKGDSFASIARQLGTSMNDLIAVNRNRIKNNMLYPKDTVIYYDQMSGSKPAAQPQTSSAADSLIRYRVRRGENLWSISRTFDVSVDKICSINKMKPTDILSIGQILLLPKKAIVDQQPASAQNSSQSKTIRYKVKPGDNLWQISRLFNTTVAAIRNANNYRPNQLLRAGDIILIPAKN